MVVLASKNNKKIVIKIISVIEILVKVKENFKSLTYKE